MKLAKWHLPEEEKNNYLLIIQVQDQEIHLSYCFRCGNVWAKGCMSFMWHIVLLGEDTERFQVFLERKAANPHHILQLGTVSSF